MRIGTVDIDKEVLIIAEIGNNHEGSFEAAVKMLHAAADAGVQAVKFQTYKTELYANPHHDEARFKRLKRFELTQDQFKKLKDTADTRGVMFLSTPFDLESAEFLNELVPAFKIGSGENTFYPLLEKIASFCKPIIMSCGISEVSSIRAAKTAIEAVWKRHTYTGELALLHCVSAYPTKPEEANLLAIKRLQREFGGVVGYSDHTLGIEAAVVSLGLGARIVEKHFTLDKNYSDFRDHHMSADPDEMSEMVRRINTVQLLLGKEDKILQEGEMGAKEAMRRSIVAKNALRAGTTIEIEHITWTRPAGGIAPGEEKRVLGKRLTRDLMAGEVFRNDDLA